MSFLKRLFLVALLLAPAPALADYDNLVCAMTLKACDYIRAEDGTCREGARGTAQIYAEGENWHLKTDGIVPGGGERLLELKNHMTKPLRVYVIYADQGLDGAFSHTADGAAELTVFALQDNSVSEDYWTGTCQPPG